MNTVNKSYDAIIIGAGIGGLSCANYLSQKGKTVIVLEQHITPGGYICGFKRKNYYFDGANTSFSSHGIIFPLLKEMGIDQKINFKLHNISVAVPEIDLRFKYRDFPTFSEAMAKAFADEKRIGEYLQVLEDFYCFFKIIEKYPVPIIYFGMERILSTMAYSKILFEKGIMRILKSFIKYGRMDCETFAGEFFPKGSNAYNFFRNYGNPKQSATVLGAMISEFISDKWYPQQGEQHFADVLAQNAQEHGAEFQYKTLVTKIITKNGKAIGVETNKGNFYGEYIISGADYRKTFNKLLDKPELLKIKFKEDLDNAGLSESLFNVYVGAKYTGQELESIIGGNHMFYYPKLEPKDLAKEKDSIDFFKNVVISIFVPSLIYPELAPEGCSSIIVQCLCPNRWMNNWGDGDKEEYKKLKNMVTEQMMDTLRKVLPDIDERIEVMEGASPRTYERYTLNSDGAYCAWSWEPNRSFFNDVGIHFDTPIENLFCCSDWTYKIGGMVSAIIAGKAIANKIG